MKNEDMNKLISGIREKLGKETSAKISDDLGTILTDNNTMNTDKTQLEEQMEVLKKDKEDLISANGNLLKQVSMGQDTFDKPKKEEDKPKFSFRNCFDNKGNFI